jgi:hypothetical protein
MVVSVAAGAGDVRVGVTGVGVTLPAVSVTGMMAVGASPVGTGSVHAASASRARMDNKKIMCFMGVLPKSESWQLDLCENILSLPLQEMSQFPYRIGQTFTAGPKYYIMR